MLQMPETNATAKESANGPAPTAAMFTLACRPSRRAAPAITGLARRKLNSAAAVGSRPDHSAAVTVDPEREIPRKSAATDCASPIPTAPPRDGSGREPNRPRVDQ